MTLDRLAEIVSVAAVAVAARRRMTPTGPIAAAIVAQQQLMRVALGLPVEPTPPDPTLCQACPHRTWRHTATPGQGCRVAGCLCLETPDLITGE